MSGFNLPPGVSVSDIPGNRPEDELWDELLDNIAEDANKNLMSDMDVFVAWQIGLSSYLTMRKLGVKLPHD